MSIAAPSTAYDLNFRLWGVPVRVHPFFWLFSAMLGIMGIQDDLGLVALWVGCVFVSILVHEFGHALMGKRFGGTPSILLYSLGGLCYSGTERTPWQRLAVVLAGPAAGFSLLLATLALVSLTFGVTPREHLALISSTLGFVPDLTTLRQGALKMSGGWTIPAYLMLVQINLFWTLINLLPIWPLDGGQATQVLLSQANPRDGVRWSHVISLLVAGVVALFLGMRMNDWYIALFMGYFAYTNYQVLQNLHDARRAGYQDDEWWRK